MFGDSPGRPARLLGPLEPFADDPAVTDVLVNGGDGVWVDRGGGPERVRVDLGGEVGVRALAVRLAAAAGSRLDESRPWVDARLPDGIRMHAVVPPVSPAGTHLSLRMLRPGRLDLAALDAAGSLPPGWAEVLRALVASRAAFLVTGGTGAGKTTLLAALLSLVPASERLVLVEDVGELHPVHPHVVRLEARHANVEGRGEVSLADLTRQALRMRPDRIVVGECRGPEVRDLLAALNTGHAGGCATLHANAAADVPARLEALGGVRRPRSRRRRRAGGRRVRGGPAHAARRGLPAPRRARRAAEDRATDPSSSQRWRPGTGATPVRYDGPSWAVLGSRLGLRAAR